MCNAYNHSPGCMCGWGGEGHLGHSYGVEVVGHPAEPSIAPMTRNALHGGTTNRCLNSRRNLATRCSFLSIADTADG